MQSSRRLSGSTSEGSSALHSDLFLLAKPDRTLVCQDRARRHCARRVHVGARLAEKAHEVHPALQQRAKDSKVALLRSYASHYSQFSRYRPLVQANLGHELGKARIGAQRIGHGIGAKIDEAVVTLLVGSIKPIESGVVVTEARVNSREIERGNVTRLGKALEIGENFASARGVAGESQRVPVQGNHDGMIAGEFPSCGKLLQSLAVHLLLAIGGAQPNVGQPVS